MLKYTNTQVVFTEIPNHISLAINISNCQNNCIGCHSPYLKENIGNGNFEPRIKMSLFVTAVA